MPPMHLALDTALCRLTGIRYPIVQTGMGFVADSGLAAATSRAGGLGVIASATMSLPELATAVREVKEATDAPFAVNVRSGPIAMTFFLESLPSPNSNS